ncbi:hypothetical protein CRE_13764 [Caenorhabditis remanei]|uniref:Uncharacterized protein n=1 Tax=Caenorhabditis remanei TaxID=31234 RepID=E3NIN1_CAERE|nr:hypothetical protein CRE_13764 [Caenorhabditis remanei]
MSTKRVRLTTRGLLLRIEKRIKLDTGCNEVDKDSELGLIDQENVSERCLKELSENVFSDTDEKFEQEEEHLDSLERRDYAWRMLSNQDLNRLYFLLTTTQSKSATNRYFNCEGLESEKYMKTILYDTSSISTITICARCGEDVICVNSKCLCGADSVTSEINFCNLEDRLLSMIEIYGKKMLKSHNDIISGRTSSSPMACGLLRDQLLKEYNEGMTKIHFITGFDGIKLHNRGKLKCWVHTMVPLDLEDKDRASPRATILTALYFSSSDPSFKVHDRITKWIQSLFSNGLVWNRKSLIFHLQTGVHDDQARRKLYNLRGHSSKGSCPYCLNQQTLCKINDNNAVLRQSIQNVPDDMEDGLTVRGYNTFFHSIAPMYECPIDLFHTFHEGAFEKIINEVYCNSKHDCSRLCEISSDANPCLPSRFRQLSGRIREITGSERSLVLAKVFYNQLKLVFQLFESTVVASSLISFPGVPSAIVFAIHVLYRLNIDPASVTDRRLSAKVEAVCKAIAPLIVQFAPNLINGSKLHVSGKLINNTKFMIPFQQIIYHLSESVKRYGSLAPVSTQGHEHLYHTLQRTLCTEITNGIGKCLLRNVAAVQELQSEFIRRTDENPGILYDCTHAQKLADYYGMSPRDVAVYPSVPPDDLYELVEDDDDFLNTQYINGVRYSSLTKGKTDDTNVMFRKTNSVGYGKILGFLRNRNGCDIRVIIKPYKLSEIHLRRMATNLMNASITREQTQSLIDVFCDPVFGAVVSGHADIIVITTREIIGHAILMTISNTSLVLPFSTRILSS